MVNICHDTQAVILLMTENIYRAETVLYLCVQILSLLCIKLCIYCIAQYIGGRQCFLSNKKNSYIVFFTRIFTVLMFVYLFLTLIYILPPILVL